jgi:dihydrofolate reductase
MPRLVVTSFVTLDGVMQAPGGPREDRSGAFLHGGWVMPFADEGFGTYVVDLVSRAGALLLGRGTYDIFAAHWPKITDPKDPIAVPFNRLPKYVASRSLERPSWQGTTVLRDVPVEVERLKAGALPGELQVHGSPGLVQTLLAYELVDELHLFQFPIVLGKGKRLFGAGTVPTAFQLVATRTTAKGVLISQLRPAGRPQAGDATVEDPLKEIR